MTCLGENLKDVGFANWSASYGKEEPDKHIQRRCVDLVACDGGMDTRWCKAKMSYICKIDKTVHHVRNYYQYFWV